MDQYLEAKERTYYVMVMMNLIMKEEINLKQIHINLNLHIHQYIQILNNNINHNINRRKMISQVQLK